MMARIGISRAIAAAGVLLVGMVLIVLSLLAAFVLFHVLGLQLDAPSGMMGAPFLAYLWSLFSVEVVYRSFGLASRIVGNGIA